MRRGDVVIPREVGNCPRDLDALRAMKGAGRELQLLHRRAHARLTRRVEFAHFVHTHIGGPLTSRPASLVRFW